MLVRYNSCFFPVLCPICLILGPLECRPHPYTPSVSRTVGCVVEAFYLQQRASTVMGNRTPGLSVFLPSLAYYLLLCFCFRRFENHTVFSFWRILSEWRCRQDSYHSQLQHAVREWFVSFQTFRTLASCTPYSWSTWVLRPCRLIRERRCDPNEGISGATQHLPPTPLAWAFLPNGFSSIVSPSPSLKPCLA
ncbi:hypothetical protein V8C44DRAFT_122146 [Trichoderma aethiopicum]